MRRSSHSAPRPKLLLMKATSNDSPHSSLPFSTESWRTKQFDFSKPSTDPAQAQPETIPAQSSPEPDAKKVIAPYRDFLVTTLPKGWTADAPHMKLIGEHLDAIDRGEIDRLAIHMPPRHGKSETTTIRYPVRYLMNNPEQNVLLTGFNERFARKLGRKARGIANQLADQGLMHLDRAKKAADEWATTAGGLLMTRGVGSPPTGTGFWRIVIDDPIRKRADAESETFRENLWDWYTDDLYTRLEPGGAIILVMTLWHDDDVGARAVASEPNRWTVLKLPALADENDPLGRLPGEALWPDRWPVEALERTHRVMAKKGDERNWLALYQQRPTPREGAFFKVAKFQYCDAVPAGLRIVRRWDMAATEGAGAYTVGVKMGTPMDKAHAEYGKYFVLDVVRGQWSTDDRDKQIRATAELDGKSVHVGGPQDPGSAGVDAAKAFVRNLNGFTARTDRVSGDKETRADPYSSQVNVGNVVLVRGPWNPDFVGEHRGFPDGKYKDQVDAAADAYNDLTTTAGRIIRHLKW